MNTAARKAKGRRLQKLVCKELLKVGKACGDTNLTEDDIRSTPMGASGVDVWFSSRAKRLFNLSIECKNQEALNVVNAFKNHCCVHEKTHGRKILIHSKNHHKPMVTLSLDDFLSLLATEFVANLNVWK